MFNISKYLDKFSKHIKYKEDNSIIIIDTIKRVTGVEIGKNDLEIKNNILYIKTTPGVKNKIYIFKKDILGDIDLNTEIKIVDIR